MTKIEIRHRDNCRLCLSEDVELAIPFKPVAIAEKYVDEEPKDKQQFVPVDLYMCKSCGHVQILDIIDPEYLWGDYTYHSGQTQGIIDHFSDVGSNIIENYDQSENKFVIDVGSNDGTLLRFFKNRGYQVLGVDPATEIAAKATAQGIKTIPTLLTEKLGEEIVCLEGKAGVITAFNVFAHADDMISLGKSIKKMLADDGVFIFEVSYLLDIIDKMLIGTIFHEHLCHHSLAPMKQFLESVGLEIFDVERVSIQGGSIIGYVQHVNGCRSIEKSVEKLLNIEDEYQLHTLGKMHQFNDQLDVMKSQVRNIVDDFKAKGLSVAGYGAARSGPMLIAQFGLTGSIEYVFDDHPQKVGKLTPGDLLPVVPTKEIDARMPALTIVLAWIHAKKIIRNHTDYLKNGGAFLTLTPRVKLHTCDTVFEYE